MHNKIVLTNNGEILRNKIFEKLESYFFQTTQKRVAFSNHGNGTKAFVLNVFLKRYYDYKYKKIRKIIKNKNAKYFFT